MRTYTPRGKTPILKVPLTRDHLSAFSAITSNGDLYLSVQDRAYRSKDVVHFLEHLRRHVSGLLQKAI